MSDALNSQNAPETAPRHVGLVGAVIAAAFAYRVALIHLFPTLYSWDAFTRLLDPARLLVRHWMPIPQLPIFVADLAGSDIVTVRLAYAAIGTAGAALVGWYSLKMQGSRAGLATLLLASALPSFVIYTLVPYQEGSLVLFLFAFLCAWKQEPGEMSKLARVVAAASLALACLCRYEAWVFAAIFAVRPACERRLRDLWIFAPSILAIGWWLLTLPTLDTANPMATHPSTSPMAAGSSPLLLVAETFWLSIQGFHYVGLPLASAGAVLAFRRGGLFGREVVLFWVALCVLTLYRAIHTSLPTERMTILPLVVATLYMPMGLVALFRCVTIGARTMRIAQVAIIAALVLLSGFTTIGSLDHREGRYAHERAAALGLEQLLSSRQPGERIGIVPRQIENTWGESTLKAIFGQSMSLRPDAPYWVLGLERVMEEQDSLSRIIAFDPATSRYQSLLPPGAPRETGSGPPIASVESR